MVMKGEEKQWQQGGREAEYKRTRKGGGGSDSESECSNVNVEPKKRGSLYIRERV